MKPGIVRSALPLLFLAALSACGETTLPTQTEEGLLAAHGDGQPAEAPTIVDVAVAAASDDEAPEFTILVQAIEAAGLVDALSRRGQRTVFAPTDAAFEALLELLGVSAEELLADTELVKEVLLYHVAPGRRDFEDVTDSEQIRTLDGRFIFPEERDGEAYIVDGSDDTADARLLAPDLVDIDATNGIIHAIDQVLLPGDGGRPGHRDDDDDDEDEDDDEGEFEGIASLVSVEGEAPTRSMRVEVTDEDGHVVTVDIVEGHTAFDDDGDLTDFDALLAALEAADSRVELEGEGSVQDDGSILADEVEAEIDDDDEDDHEGEFEGIASLVSVEGEAPNRSLRVEVVDHHWMAVMVDVVEGHTAFDDDGDLTDFDALLAALEAGDPPVELEGEGSVQDDGSILAREVKAEIDDDEDDDDLTIAELVARFANDGENPEFTILFAALQAADLVHALDTDDDDLTVFAPTDAAFGRLLELLHVTAEELLGDRELLTQVLLYHVVPDDLTSDEVVRAERIETLQGSALFPLVTDEGAFLVDGSDLTENARLLPGLLDIEADNGIIHVIDQVLLF